MSAFPQESAISTATQDISAASNDSGSLSMTLTKFLVLGGFIVAAVVASKRWFYPYTVEDLEGRVGAIDRLIRDNTNYKLNILGDSANGLRKLLERHHKEVQVIRTKANAEPDRTKVITWIAFQLSQMREIKARYLSLQELELNVTVEVERVYAQLRDREPAM
ncbi:hypothetical protein L218DRAFT_1003116 [Marasmius fiardii PR-910]|nr:hypothetical protein L218DRAFT_1003116 [Marasmius fiardii PR-910]